MHKCVFGIIKISPAQSFDLADVLLWFPGVIGPDVQSSGSPIHRCEPVVSRLSRIYIFVRLSCIPAAIFPVKLL